MKIAPNTIDHLIQVKDHQDSEMEKEANESYTTETILNDSEIKIDFKKRKFYVSKEALESNSEITAMRKFLIAKNFKEEIAEISLPGVNRRYVTSTTTPTVNPAYITFTNVDML